MSMLKSENTPARWPSFYDLTPAKALLTRYVDFSQLKSSPIRLLIQAVDVQTGELAMFDSYIDDITPAHVLASGSLPPHFLGHRSKVKNIGTRASSATHR